MRYATLDENHNLVFADDCLVWARYFEENNRTVKQTELPGDVLVSTVFLGLNHSFGVGKDLWFETMVFGGQLDGEQERCETWGEAEAQHDEIVARVRALPAAPEKGEND